MTQPSRTLLDLWKPMQAMAAFNPWLSAPEASTTPSCKALQSLAAHQAEMQRALWSATEGTMTLAGKLPELYLDAVRGLWQLAAQARPRLTNVQVAAPQKAPRASAAKADPAQPRAARAVASKRAAKRRQAPQAQRDDLKQISGVGPVLEKKLNAAGIRTFAQIAEFAAADIRRLEAEVIRFPGRIKRDKWIAQAKKLMKT